jgi:MFS family permease
MSRAQRRVIGLTGVISALDGFDLLSVTFVAPVLARSFEVDSAAIGLLLSAGLLGALIGSVALAPLADVFGRRPIALTCLGIMVAGMGLSALCTALAPLVAVRLLTGVGIGAMMVVINPIAVEVANRRTRSFAVAMMSVGYPLGGALGGAASAVLLRYFDWQSVFALGALLTLLVLPFAAAQLPESLAFLLTRRRHDSLIRVNAVLRRFGHADLPALPPVDEDRRAPYREIVRGRQLPVTLVVCVISLLMYMTIYFFLSWQPSMLVGLGLDPSAAATVSSASSLAGAFACVVFGVVSRRVSGHALAVVSILGLGFAVVAFGLVPAAPALVVVVAVLAGGGVAAATVGLLVTAAEAFPAPLRATGTGVVLGVGRVGSALAPALAGTLFAAGATRPTVAAVMGGFAVLAGVLLVLGRALTRSRSTSATPDPISLGAPDDH